MTEYTFESPVDLVKHLYAGENTPTGICGRPSVLFKWYSNAKRFYDVSLCKACRPKYTDQEMESMYAEIIQYPHEEKYKAVLAVGGSFTLKLRGEVLGEVSTGE